MRLIALYKTYDGEDWLETSMASVYNYVDRIVIFDSPVSWLGERKNTCEAALRRFIVEADDLGKLYVVCYESQDQDDQYAHALQHVYVPGWLDPTFDYVLIVDADELWDAGQIEAACDYILKDGCGPAYSVSMKTYIKSPYYRITPPEPCKPCVFVRKDVMMRGARGNKTPGLRHIPDVYFHHFTAVRADETAIRRKILQSNHADGEQAVPVETWFTQKWDKLPDATNFHYSAGYENAWQGVEVIAHEDLPLVLRLRDHPLVDVWRHTQKVGVKDLPFGELTAEDEVMLRKYARSRQNVVDLGTLLGRSAAIMAEVAERVTTVDLHEHTSEILNPDSRKHYESVFQRWPHPFAAVKHTLAAWSNITALHGITCQAVETNVDLLFVDDDHSYEGAERVLEAYLPRLAPGAWVLFHDTAGIPEHGTGVRDFVYTVLRGRPDFTLAEEGGSITAWKYQPKGLKS